jgi:ElaB/YqjD/DUF883 family membrane-anchored ribosome-binding protein
MPLWLIGAGLFLTSKRGRQVAEDVQGRVGEVVQQGTEKAGDLASAARAKVEDRIGGARHGAGEARDAVTSAVGGLADQARAAFHDALDAATSGVQEGASKAANGTEDVGAAFSKTTAAVKSRAGEVTERAADMARTSRYAITDFVNDNAFLIAGIGAAVGAVIAASIPPSEAENRLFGRGSEKVKAKAREAAAQGIEKVGDIAAETAGSVAAAAAREGLDATGIQGALNKVADGVRAVADRGLDTALGKQQTSQASEPFQNPMPERNQL